MKRALPYLNESPSKTFIADAYAAATKIKAAYGDIVKAAAASTGVHPTILVGFMTIENDQVKPEAKSYSCTPKRDATSDCYVGLLQMGAETAFDTLKAQVAGGCTPAETAIINKYLPGLIKGAGTVGLYTTWKKPVYAALMKAEFSIWLGALHLAQLMKRTTDSDGDFRLDHVIVKYNRGVGNYQKEVVNTGMKNADSATLAKNLPVLETRAYIVKFVGIDGAIMQARKAGF